jgi:hypothetical protein
MNEVFDETRLDDETALEQADQVLRPLAEAGARVRRESAEAADALADAVHQIKDDQPRAVVAAGPDSRLLRAVLEPHCPVPFVAWPGPGLPGWAGSLDLVVMLAPDGEDPGSAATVSEAVRRGAQVVVGCPPDSLVARHAAGRHATLLPARSHDQLATAVVVLDLLSRVGLGPAADPDEVADALDEVAIACSPHRDQTVNPAKLLAVALGDCLPVVWGGSVLAARAARRVAESMRRASGRSALAGDAEHLVPVLAAAPARDLFDDPFADGYDGQVRDPRPALVVLDDGSQEPGVHESRTRLTEVADDRDVRVEVVESATGTDLARYASLLGQGRYAAAYLGIGLGRRLF